MRKAPKGLAALLPLLCLLLSMAAHGADTTAKGDWLLLPERVWTGDGDAAHAGWALPHPSTHLWARSGWSCPAPRLPPA
jgi:hypothetical protein